MKIPQGKAKAYIVCMADDLKDRKKCKSFKLQNRDCKYYDDSEKTCESSIEAVQLANQILKEAGVK